jgi:hypothetical protein
MGNKIIVLTMYGKDKSIESISISLFDTREPYYPDQKNNALNYCNTINDLELAHNQLVYASIIDENKKILLDHPIKFDIINTLDDRALQRVLREVSKIDLANALQGLDEKTRNKIFRNMSKRAAAMLKEDAEIVKNSDNRDSKNSRKKIIEIIQKLVSRGEMVY